MSEIAEYQDAVSGIEQSYRDALRAFTNYFEKNWQFEGETEWKKAYAEPYPGDAWVDAHNTGVQAVQTALDMFLDELH